MRDECASNRERADTAPSARGHAMPNPTDSTIVRAAIHPGIGIARIGNSQGGYFIGPEITTPPPQAADYYRDQTGAIKRQAARFRVYGYNAAGDVGGAPTPRGSRTVV